MGSSEKTGKFCFLESPEHFLDKNAIWDRTPPHLHINCSLHVWGRVQGSQIFKRNSIISIRSKVMAFLVILLSPRRPRGPHVVPFVPTSSPHHPRGPHIVSVIPIANRRSPCGLHMSTSSPHRPRCLHVVPTLSPWSPHRLRHPHGQQKVPMWSPHVVPIIPVVPVVSTLSLLSPHRLEGPHIISNPPAIHSTHPHPLEGGGNGPKSVKMQ